MSVHLGVIPEHTNVGSIASSIVTSEIYGPVLFVFRFGACDGDARCQKHINRTAAVDMSISSSVA